MQDWHGNAIYDSALVNGTVTVTAAAAASPNTPVATCSSWTYLSAPVGAWRCNVDNLNTAGIFTLTLSTSSAQASGWSGASYKKNVTIVAQTAINAAQTEAAIFTLPVDRFAIAGERRVSMQAIFAAPLLGMPCIGTESIAMLQLCDL